MRNIEGKNNFTSGKRTSELYLSLVISFIFVISATPSFSRSLLSQIYHMDDDSRSEQYLEYLTFQGITYNSYDWKIQAILSTDCENGDFEKPFEIAKFLLSNDKEAGFDILEFLYGISIHEVSNDTIVISIYLLFAQECEKRGIYDAAGRAYERIATIYDNNGNEEEREVMKRKKSKSFLKAGETIIGKTEQLIEERREEESQDE